MLFKDLRYRTKSSEACARDCLYTFRQFAEPNLIRMRPLTNSLIRCVHKHAGVYRIIPKDRINNACVTVNQVLKLFPFHFAFLFRPLTRNVHR